MEAIRKLIFNELAQRRRVILPGLGALLTEQEPAAWKAETDTLSVPRTRVVFSPGEGDGETIVERIAALSGIPPKDIRPQYNRWSAELKKGLEAGRIEIEGVCTLVSRPDGSVEITLSATLDNLLNPLGKSTLHLPELQSERKRKKSKGAVGWIVGVLLLLLAGAGYYGYTRGWFDPLIERITSRSTAVPTPAPIPIAEPTPRIEPVGEPLIDSLPRTGSVDDPVPQAVPADAAYHLIAGVFSTRENAERYIREEGFDAAKTVVRLTSGGRFQVSIGAYPAKEQADSAMYALRTKYPGVWVAEK